MISSPSRSLRPGGLPPAAVMSAAVAVGLAVVGVVLLLAHAQPWLGVSLLSAPEGGVVVVESTGPAAGIPEGTRILAIAGNDREIELKALDLVIEPDGSMGDYQTYREFLSRQDRLADILASGEVRLTTADGRVETLVPDQRGRPFTSFPPVFWVQLVVGLVAWLVSATVFAFRPKDAAARYLLLSGAATLLFSPAAAIYSTRELALDGTLFHWAGDLNFFGGSLFIASFIALLLHYPRPLGPRWAGLLVVALFVGWFVAQQVGVFESMTFARRFLVVAGVCMTFILAGIHWFRTGRTPVERAALQWFLLSWMLGTSAFVLFILLPQLFGVDTSPLQGYAFLLFLLVYGGLAFGILRYRLFELGIWWRRIAVWTLTVLLLVVLDMLFLLGLRMSPGMSLSLTLLVCGVVWLPLRTWMWQRIRGARETHPAEWFGRVMDVALAPSEGARDDRWRKLLEEIFSPLGVENEERGRSAVLIEDDGLSMSVPAVGGLPSLRLKFAAGGRRLFSRKDATLAGELVKSLEHAIASRSAYESGVAEERSRIARDIHDNIGAQLLAALHSDSAERKDARIRESLEDLRSVINDFPAEALTLDEAFGELRAESSERLSSAGISLRWEGDGCDRTVLESSIVHALRSILREAVSNVIRHSGARHACVTVAHGGNSLRVSIGDDGVGSGDFDDHRGNGLANMRARLARLGGSLEIRRPERGTQLDIHIPLDHERRRTA
jgi:two-component system sensor histidine kinase DevS